MISMWPSFHLTSAARTPGISLAQIIYKHTEVQEEVYKNTAKLKVSHSSSHINVLPLLSYAGISVAISSFNHRMMSVKSVSTSTAERQQVRQTVIL